MTRAGRSIFLITDIDMADLGDHVDLLLFPKSCNRLLLHNIVKTDFNTVNYLFLYSSLMDFVDLFVDLFNQYIQHNDEI